MASEAGMGRRDFLKTSAKGVAGVAAASTAFNLLRPERVLGANDRVNVAVVGPGHRGRDLIRLFHEHSKDLNMEIVAVCDIWKEPRQLAAKLVEDLSGRRPKMVRNTDELYSMKGIDAVIIATADFQHAYHATEAVKAGKDVYVEKPLAHTMKDAKMVLKAVSESDRVVQVGTQRRSGPNYQAAAEFIQSGKFGPITFVELVWNVNQPKRWRRFDELKRIRKEDTDWGRYLINLPYRPWNPRYYLEFRLFWPFSSGIPDQWMVHQIDTVAWFAQDPYPETCIASGRLEMWKDGRTNPDTFTAVFEYSKGFQVLYTSRQHNSYGGVKELYFSNYGTLDLKRNKITGEGGLDARHSLDGKDHRLPDMDLPKATTVTGVKATGGTASLHMRNWMECIRSRKQPNAPIEAGYAHSVALCMAIESMQTGKKVRFDRATQEIVPV